ncbi:hypothetical protein LTR78_011007, partial [Recurvomyces mirabilis]
MEEKLLDRLGLADGSRVLDAGAGSGIVASYLANHGLRVDAIDLLPRHVADAPRRIHRSGLQDLVDIHLADYHHIPVALFPDQSFDGVFTMETFVHADEPLKVLNNFYRLLRPGGVLVLHEADFYWESHTLQEILRLSHCGNALREGEYERLLYTAGFRDISVKDYTANVLPLWRLFGMLSIIPYGFARLLGIQNRIPNTMAGAEIYRYWGQGRYIAVKAIRPI